MQIKLIFLWKTITRFETEAQGNSEMAYFRYELKQTRIRTVLIP